MTLTEEEARTKWCPARMIAAAVHFGNPSATITDPEKAHQCIASECMAWRASKGDDGVYSATHGCCGLAGKP